MGTLALEGMAYGNTMDGIMGMAYGNTLTL